MAAANDAIVIREETSADEPFLKALLRDMHAATFIGMDLSEDMVAILLDQQFRAQRVGCARTFPNAEHLLIEREGDPVGRMTVSVHREDGGFTARIVDIAVLASARGRGIGTRAISRLETAAREMGVDQLALSALLTNDQAIRLYNKLGFIAIAEVDGLHISMVKRLG
jgi:ribosomal protein S18 acetylase RimI-like enzyme